MKKESLIYILTNPDFAENEIKIGYTTDLKTRLSFYNCGAPKDYKIFATYDVPFIKGHKPDIILHNLLEKLNPDIRVNENKEFFYLYPEDAYEILKSIAIIHDRLDCLHLFVTCKKRKPINDLQKQNDKRTYFAANATLVSNGDGSFTLLKNSEIRLANNKESNAKILKKQNDLITGGAILRKDNKLILTTNLLFKSPSGPADLVFGCAENGWTVWKNKDGKTLDEIERKSK